MSASPSERIETLQKSLSRAVSGRITALEEITRRQADAQSTIEAFAVNPSPEQVAKLFAAHAALATGRELLARFGDLKSWQVAIEASWISTHRLELTALLQKFIDERSASTDDAEGDKNRFRIAQDALRNFERATEHPNGYLPLFKHYLNTRDTVFRVDLAISQRVVTSGKT